MNYELAKQLKDAGFPQIGYSQGYSGFFAPRNVYEPETEAYFPTLSELIEACGDGFKGLIKSGTIGEEYTYEVYSSITEEEDGYSDYSISKRYSPYGHGSTPEEAVANLWLALNKLDKNDINSSIKK